jgi:hypothetical protein
MKLHNCKPVLFLAMICFMISVHAQTPSLSKKEMKDGWILLFDGKSLDGWQKSNGTPLTGKGWKIDSGMLSVSPVAGGDGDIVTTTQFSDFELTLDFKLEKGSNSGVKYFLIKNTSLGCEYQLIDDINHPDARLGKNGNRSLAALYDILPPLPDKKTNPPGEWNSIRIYSKGKNIEHWLNGKKVLSYERGSELFNEKISESKFKDTKGFATTDISPILLQEHGEVIFFRNIKIRKI